MYAIMHVGWSGGWLSQVMPDLKTARFNLYFYRLGDDDSANTYRIIKIADGDKIQVLKNDCESYSAILKASFGRKFIVNISDSSNFVQEIMECLSQDVLKDSILHPKCYLPMKMKFAGYYDDQWIKTATEHDNIRPIDTLGTAQPI